MLGSGLRGGKSGKGNKARLPKRKKRRKRKESDVCVSFFLYLLRFSCSRRTSPLLSFALKPREIDRRWSFMVFLKEGVDLSEYLQSEKRERSGRD
jgi:hypothetical protein